MDWQGAVLAALHDEVNRNVPGPFQGRIRPVEFTGLGDFPWSWGSRDNFNPKTFQYICSRVMPGHQSGVSVRLYDSFLNAYSLVMSDITVSLSDRDQKRQADLSITVDVLSHAVVAAYKRSFGEISPGALADASARLRLDATEFDYIVGYVVGCQWSCAERDGKDPITVAKMRQARHLADLLPCTPSGGQGVLDALSDYLNALNNLCQLTDRLQEQTWAVRTAEANTEKPAPQNGCIHLRPEEGRPVRIPAPGYSLSRDEWEIWRDLQDTTRGFSFTMQADQTDTQTVRLRVGAREVAAPISFLTAAGRPESAPPLPIHRLRGAGQSVKVTVVYTGLSVIPVMADHFEPATGKGWFFPEAVTEAIGNTHPGDRPTGLVFADGIQPFDWGGFGQIRALVVSNQPSVSIDFPDGDPASLAEQFSAEPQWKLAVADVLDVGALAPVDLLRRSNRGFTVLLNPVAKNRGPDLAAGDRYASVVGIVPDYPGIISLA